MFTAGQVLAAAVVVTLAKGRPMEWLTGNEQDPEADSDPDPDTIESTDGHSYIELTLSGSGALGDDTLPVEKYTEDYFKDSEFRLITMNPETIADTPIHITWEDADNGEGGGTEDGDKEDAKYVVAYNLYYEDDAENKPRWAGRADLEDDGEGSFSLTLDANGAVEPNWMRLFVKWEGEEEFMFAEQFAIKYEEGAMPMIGDYVTVGGGDGNGEGGEDGDNGDNEE